MTALVIFGIVNYNLLENIVGVVEYFFWYTFKLFTMIEKNKGNDFGLKEIETYRTDGRLSLDELYGQYDQLREAGWQREVLCIQSEKNGDGGVLEIPVYGYLSGRIVKGDLPSKSFLDIGRRSW